MDVRLLFCRLCGIRAWVINGDRSLFQNHLRRVHRSH